MLRMTTERAQREAHAVDVLTTIGDVTMGAPVPPDDAGCSMCLWHLDGADGNNIDGGTATMFVANAVEGYYKVRGATLHPVVYVLAPA